MKEQADLIDYFSKHGKDKSWLELAKQFNILPKSTNKQRSDKTRKLYNSWFKKQNLYLKNTHEEYSEVDYTRTATPSIKVLKHINYLTEEDLNEFIAYKAQKEKRKIKPFVGGDINNVLVIGDLHSPFELKGYLEFCREQQERFNCGTVVFIGDLIDSHFSSYHETNPDGFSAGLELETAINRLQEWYYTFPQAVVTIGNHDRIIARKLYTSGISARWLKPIEEVLNTPTWKFVEEFIHNGVLYIHGEGGTAKTKMQQEHISVVQGHNHTECYIDFNMTKSGVKFSMQVGTGIDFKQYAFGYAQRGKTPMTSCGVILNGTQPIIIPCN